MPGHCPRCARAGRTERRMSETDERVTLHRRLRQAAEGKRLLRRLKRETGFGRCFLFCDPLWTEAAMPLLPGYAQNCGEKLLLLFTDTGTKELRNLPESAGIRHVTRAQADALTAALALWNGLPLRIASPEMPCDLGSAKLEGYKGISKQDILLADVFAAEAGCADGQHGRIPAGRKRRLKEAAKRVLGGAWQPGMVLLGGVYWHRLRNAAGSRTLLFLRGPTGDAYLLLSYLPEYLSQSGIRDAVLTGDAKNLSAIAGLYGREALPVSEWQASCIQRLYLLMGGEALGMRHLLPWGIRGKNLNLSRMRTDERLTFMDSIRRSALGLDEDAQPVFPELSEAEEEQKARWQAAGILPGRTVILSPAAYSLKPLPDGFWRRVCDGLERQGWNTVFCCDPQREPVPVPGKANCFFPYREGEALLRYAGGFLAVRSGLCDVVSRAACRMVILHPPRPERPDRTRHRSDRAFCGLTEMGLRSETGELETPLLREKYEPGPALGTGEIQREEDRLATGILRAFGRPET